MHILNPNIKKLITFFLLLYIPASQFEAREYYLKFDHLTVDNGLPQNHVHSIAKDKYGFMWFGTWYGACRYDGYSFKVFRANEDDTTSLSDNMINAIAVDSLQNIWIETGDLIHLFKYNYESERFERFTRKKTPSYILDLIKKAARKKNATVQNKKFKFTVETFGLRQYSISSNQVVYYQSNPNDPFSLSDNSIYSIYIDNTENLWVGTRNGGINHANLNFKPFNYYHADKIGKGLIENGVRAICRDNKGRMWIGSEDKGVTIIERNSNTNIYSYLGNNKLIDTKIRSICCDKLGFIWIGSCGGLDRFDPHTNKIKHYVAKVKGGICDPRVYAIVEDHKGILWVGTLMGLAMYDRANDQFTCIQSSKAIVGKQVRAILEDRSQNLWIATEDGGLTKILRDMNGNPDLNHPIHYTHKANVKNSIISNRIYSLTEDNDGIIWVGTNFGLSRFSPKTNTFKHFTNKSGLPDDMIMGVLFDGKKHVWLSHKKGITRLDKKTFEIKNFNGFDGLQGNDFNQSTCFRDTTNGEMYFGGTNGFNSFHPDSIKVSKYKARVVFTRLSVMNQIIEPGVKVNNRVVLKKSLLCTNEINLTWWDKTFSLEFSALNFANPQGCKYKYKLEGIDKQWIFTDASTRIVSYSHLPIGTYIFVVYAANNDGVWSDIPATLQINVLPPWWFTWWAIVIYIIIACIIIWFIYKYIAGQLEFRKNEEIHHAKLQFFTEVSHEFRTPLTLIIDPVEKLISENLDKETVKHYHSLIQRNAKQLLLLINQLLDFRKLETGHLSLHLQNSDIVSFIRSAASSFETHAKKQNISFSVCTAIEKLEMDFDSAKLNMVLNNLLANAFKFTSDMGKVEVNIDISTDPYQCVIIKVSDTGIGIPVEEQNKIFDIFYQSTSSANQHEGSGIGLALTKELVQLHGGKVSIESELGKGACFSVQLPISKNNELPITNYSSELIHTLEEIPSKHFDISDDTLSDMPLLLMVDDNADIRNYIALNFSKSYHIVMAKNGNEGFQLGTELIPDIIISDIMMPGLNGLELCRRLKTDERTSHIPIILLTARQSDELKTEGFETGADAYITKPFNTVTLRAQIENLLKQRKRLRELFSQGSDIELKKIAINITDEVFLKKVTLMVEENLHNENFNIDILAQKLKMSRSQFYRKIKALTNQSLFDFVNTLRMKRALIYLLNDEYSISETAYKVGFSLPTNFTRAFVKFYGTTPSKYIELLKNSQTK
jgi:signal transduction histidine kinase/ligand-binding sensor domain-containing protein/DNA-binding response OmpR family regulator